MQKLEEEQYKEGELISIIIPTYNRASILPVAIGSVINQTSSNWELIIIDDGSSDNTFEVTKKYLDDPRITYFYQENMGVSSARNTGVDRACGKYLIFLDSDDFFADDLIENINKELWYSPDLICWQVTKIIDGKKKLWKPSRLSSMYNNIKATFLAGSVCFKKEIFQAIGGYDPKITFGENYELGQRISWSSNLCIKIIQKPLLHYIINTKNRTSNSLQNRLTSYIYLYKKHRILYDKNSKASAEMNYLLGFALEKSFRKKAALERYKKSWQDHPWNFKPLIKILYLKFL